MNTRDGNIGAYLNRRTHMTGRTCSQNAAVPESFPFGLKYALSHLPYGLKTAMHLASLSHDRRVRSVAARWRALDKDQQASTFLEDLCEDAGIDGPYLLGKVLSTAFELGIDVSGVIGGMMRMPEMLSSALLRARESTEGINAACAVFEYIDRSVRKTKKQAHLETSSR
jgi:hypothetical protein